MPFSREALSENVKHMLPGSPVRSYLELRPVVGRGGFCFLPGISNVIFADDGGLQKASREGIYAQCVERLQFDLSAYGCWNEFEEG